MPWANLEMRRPHLRGVPATAPLAAGYRLRPYRGEADLDGLTTTLARAFGPPPAEDRVRRVPIAAPEVEAARIAERVRRRLIAAPEVEATYVVDWHGRVVATASSRWAPQRDPDAGVVHWVATHPDHARNGLGSALVARVLRDFVERGYRYALLEVDDHRLPAIRAYLKLGFIPVYGVNREDHSSRWSSVFQNLFS